MSLEDGAALPAAHEELCAGAWSALAPGVRELIGLTLEDVHPVKGQVVELAPSPGDAPAVDRVIYGACYLVPRRDGRVVCGATMERAGFDTEVTPRATADLVAAARRTVPALADAPVASSWVGLRPATRDGLPLIGESRVRGLWLGTGHFRNGVLLAALTAELLGALVAGAADDVGALAGALGPPGLLPFAPERLG